MYDKTFLNFYTFKLKNNNEKKKTGSLLITNNDSARWLTQDFTTDFNEGNDATRRVQQPLQPLSPDHKFEVWRFELRRKPTKNE